jgi:hypothetical protein
LGVFENCGKMKKNCEVVKNRNIVRGSEKYGKQLKNKRNEKNAEKLKAKKFKF